MVVLLAIVTYVFGNIVQNIWLERHGHVHRPHNPAKLALAHIQDSLDFRSLLATDHGVAPGRRGNRFDRGSNFRQPQEIYVRILLLVMSILAQSERAEWLVVRIDPF